MLMLENTWNHAGVNFLRDKMAVTPVHAPTHFKYRPRLPLRTTGWAVNWEEKGKCRLNKCCGQWNILIQAAAGVSRNPCARSGESSHRRRTGYGWAQNSAVVVISQNVPPVGREGACSSASAILHGGCMGQSLRPVCATCSDFGSSS